MSERPTLTIAAVCQTCKGTQKRSKLVVMSNYPYTDATHERCPDCTDGTIRQAVSCKTCKFAVEYNESRWTYRCNELPNGLYADEAPEVDPDFGCLSWEAREGA